MSWRIGEILIRKKLINFEQLEEVLREQKVTKEFTGTILIRKGYISTPLLHKALAEQYGMRFIDLARTKINPKAVERLPRSIAEKYEIIPIEIHEETLTLGISNPILTWPESEIKELARVQELSVVLCIPTEIAKAIQENYGL